MRDYLNMPSLGWINIGGQSEAVTIFLVGVVETTLSCAIVQVHTHFHGYSTAFFLWEFSPKGQLKKALENRKGEFFLKKLKIVVKCTTIVGFCLHLLLPPPPLECHLHHRWFVILSLKSRDHTHSTSLLVHLPPKLLCFVLSLLPPPCNPSFLFAIHHSTLGFCKILQVTIEDAWWWWKLLCKLAIGVVRL